MRDMMKDAVDVPPKPASSGRIPKEIVLYPDPVLFQKAESIECEWKHDDAHKEVMEIFNDLMCTLVAQKTGQHLGISAPQIGISKRAMIVLGVAMVNPTWSPVSMPGNPSVEGCYSLKNGDKQILFKKWRAPYGWAKWIDPRSGELREEKLKGIKAVVFQHELDHLNGTLLENAEFMTVEQGKYAPYALGFNPSNGTILP